MVLSEARLCQVALKDLDGPLLAMSAESGVLRRGNKTEGTTSCFQLQFRLGVLPLQQPLFLQQPMALPEQWEESLA